MDTENSLAGAADGATMATETAGDIAMVLQTWSKRQPQRISAHEQQEMRRLFREVYRLLGQAEQAVELVVREQVERRIMDGGTNGAAHGGRRRQNGAGVR